MTPNNAGRVTGATTTKTTFSDFNFLGPGPEGDPRRSGLTPVSTADAAAKRHDVGYYIKGAAGPASVFTDSRVAQEDLDLAFDMVLVLNSYVRRDIDNYTGKPVDTHNAAWAAGAGTIFGTVGSLKAVVSLPLTPPPQAPVPAQIDPFALGF